MCGRGVHSILLLYLVAQCLDTIDVCIWHILLLCLLCSGVAKIVF